jgi:hypothetical protein
MKVFRLLFFPKAPISKIVADKIQDEAKDRLDAWYARLYTMAVKDDGWRELAKTIHRHGMFRDEPSAMDSLFYPALRKEWQRLEEQKKRFKRPSFSITDKVMSMTEKKGSES